MKLFMNYLKKILLICKYNIERYNKSNLFDLLYRIKILNRTNTVQYILQTDCSVSRYGDGEFTVMSGGSNGFQSVNPELANRLIEVINNPIPNHIICIPYSFKSRRGMTLDSKLFILGFLAVYGEKSVLPYLKKEYQYFDTNFTRFYMGYMKQRNCEEYVRLLKRIWNKRDLCIVEGRYSRLGVGNDLFDNANSIIRILGPEKNAFDKYDELLAVSLEYGKERLVLIALGMTATVLAYDLAKQGVQAIDVGQVDVEYEWYRMGAKTKCLIPNKYVNEVKGGDLVDSYSDKVYESQIVTCVCD